MTFHVDSEVGQLRQAIVHRPGPRAVPAHPGEHRRAALRRRHVGRQGQGGARRLRRGPAGQGRAACTTTASCWPRPSSCPTAGPSCSTGSARPRSSARRWSTRCGACSRTSTGRRWPSTWSAASSRPTCTRCGPTASSGTCSGPTTSSSPRCPTTCSSGTTRAGSTAGVTINPMAKPARQRETLHTPGHLPLPPAVRRRRLRHLLRRRGPQLPAGHHRGRRRPRHRPRGGPHRHGRADHPDGRRDGRPCAVRRRAGRPRWSPSSCPTATPSCTSTR